MKNIEIEKIRQILDIEKQESKIKDRLLKRYGLEKRIYKKAVEKYKNNLIPIDEELKEMESMKQNEIEELTNVIEDLSNKNKELKEQVQEPLVIRKLKE